jgi:hypothetical protein
LPVRLTDAEVAQRAADLANATQTRENLETQKSSTIASLTGDIKAQKLKISKLAKVVAERAEMRDVEIEESRDEERWMMVTKRLDTGEIISERQMTSEERQIQLFPASRGRNRA